MDPYFSNRFGMPRDIRNDLSIYSGNMQITTNYIRAKNYRLRK